ncbi:hypothetical protein Cob_v003833 [Colletotrichum orbiculare MAFF 240422]|uniref:Uncharacterized protein n=1 Tax=Colletotrichum orbiculare (strain 104-T / ATCC 96160 / CBS 514.97 / LARS 414 / MAFF 240422) TaxID=1213857 RepID=A0A484G0K0_COLOR|nr:hypothetical protein Cob_v003833 [Colletotrichum orbiculare MAFF 240422]
MPTNHSLPVWTALRAPPSLQVDIKKPWPYNEERYADPGLICCTSYLGDILEGGVGLAPLLHLLLHG